MRDEPVVPFLIIPTTLVPVAFSTCRLTNQKIPPMKAKVIRVERSETNTRARLTTWIATRGAWDAVWVTTLTGRGRWNTGVRRWTVLRVPQYSQSMKSFSGSTFSTAAHCEHFTWMTRISLIRG